MSDRRRLLLMAALNNGVWLPYSYEYLYHDLIPTDINGGEVKNKARVSKVYANGVIENQLNNPTQPTQTINGITFTNNGDGSWTISGTASADATKAVGTSFNRVSGHYYLLYGCPSGGSSSTFRLLEGYTYYWTDTGSGSLKQATSSGTSSLTIEVKSGTVISTPITFVPQFIDLTQMFPFDTPTTLTDKRVQALLNRGYIPYNTGTYKGTDIGMFSTTKADTTALATLSFKYQGNGAGTSHDSWEITKTEHVFTKNNASVDLGSLTYDNVGNQNVFYAQVSLMKNGSYGNELCDKYVSSTAVGSASGTNLNDKEISVSGSNNYIYIKDSSYSNATTFKSAVSGLMLTYELATPQVIRIPRKHLGTVDLGSLNWTKSGSDFFSSGIDILVKSPSATSVMANVYCSRYITSAQTQISSGKMSIAVNGTIIVEDISYANAIDFKNAMSGIYLFYETENEVADINNIIAIESGGTITSDSEVLPNVDFDIKCKR